MKKLSWFLLCAVVYEVVKRLKRDDRPSEGEYPEVEEREGYIVTRTPVGGGRELVRYRGSYDDIMRSFGVVKDKKPQLPENLDIESLPNYWGGCPHCGIMSTMGENMWRYHELSRTRGFMNNTTTFLAKCKKCGKFMHTTVDHDD